MPHQSLKVDLRRGTPGDGHDGSSPVAVFHLERLVRYLGFSGDAVRRNQQVHERQRYRERVDLPRAVSGVDLLLNVPTAAPGAGLNSPCPGIWTTVESS